MTSWSLVFPRDNGAILEVLMRYWVPEAKLADSENLYRSQYQGWVRQGWLKTTPGATIRSPFIEAQILEDAKKFKLVDMNVDPWHAQELALGLEEKGIKVAQLSQHFSGMAGPTAELHRRLLERTLRHGGNPILRWNVDNLVEIQDSAGNLKPDKGRGTARRKIDGVVALIMALDRVMRHEDDTSVYESRGLRTIG